MNTPAPPRTRLLVSIRHPDELPAALTGDADLIDIKEPSRGSLGRADWKTICEITQSAAVSQAPLSIALGELQDEFSLPVDPLPAIQFVKTGWANCPPGSDWQQRFREFRRQLTPLLYRAKWIAVSYADWKAADAPPPDEVVRFAREENFAGVLVDTWEKTGGSLLEHLTVAELQEIRQATWHSEQLLALAGSVQAHHFAALLQASPDIIAVRTAACKSNLRTGAICGNQIASLKNLLRELQPDTVTH